MTTPKLADPIAARELELYIENESSLYNQKKSIIENIKRKMKAGKYDSKLAPKLWIYWVEAGAQLYCRENKCTVANTFSPATRVMVAQSLAADYEKRIRSGEYGLVEVEKSKLKYSLVQKRINSEGYSSNGQYYGTGAPLYVAERNGIYLEFRAADRTTAKKLLDETIAAYPKRGVLVEKQYFFMSDLKDFIED